MPLDLELVEETPKLDLEPVESPTKLALEPVESHPVRDFVKRVLRVQDNPPPGLSAGEAMVRQSENEGKPAEIPWDEPLISIRREPYPTVAEPTVVGEALRGVRNKAADFIEALSTPKGMAITEAGAIAPVIVGPVVGAPMAYEGAKEAVEGYREGDVAKTAGGVAQTVLGVAGTAEPVARVGGAVRDTRAMLREPVRETRSLDLEAIDALDPMLRHDVVLPVATETFKKTIEEPTTAKGAENASSQQGSTALHGNVLRVGESARRENQAGMPINEGGEGIRVNEVQEPAVARTEETVTPETLPTESSSGTEVPRQAAQEPTQAAGTVEPAATTETGPGMVGMGAAKRGEVNEAAGEDIFGIAQRVREEMAQTGKFPYTPPGEGTTVWESIQRGKQLLRDGANPEEIMANFEKTHRLSADDVAVVRAHMEQLYHKARKIESKYGTDSQEWRTAQQKMLDLWVRSKAMGTEWHKIGQAQQGATDVDTGDLVSMAKAHQEATGKGFTKKQAEEGSQQAGRVRQTRKEASDAQQIVLNNIDKEITQKTQPQEPSYSPRVLEMAERFAFYMDKKADAAAARLREKLRNVGAGVDPSILPDLAIVGAAKITRGLTDFAKWSDAMIRDFGESIRPLLKDAFDAAQKAFDTDLNEFNKGVDKATKEGVKKAASSTVKAPKTIEEARKVFAESAAEVPPKNWKGPFTPKQTRVLWDRARNEYIAHGEANLDTIAQGLATDFGLPKSKVMEAIAGSKGVKRLTDEMYLKMSRARQAEAAARQWLIDQRYPGWIKVLKKIPRAMFSAVTFGHGTVGMVTHGGPVAFDPATMDIYFSNFAKQFGLVFSRGYHEAAIQNLMNSPNFAMWKRAGLANDPFRYYDDYSNPKMQLGMGWLTKMGNRGFDILKMFRQDLADRAWNKLTPEMQTPEMAKLLALDINRATGAVHGELLGKAQPAADVLMFAPRLEASRWAFVFKGTAEHLKTVANWKNASPEARVAAMADLGRKARILGTYGVLLATNQAVLKQIGSDQEVNYTDPSKGDFLSFKMFGHDVGVVHPITRLLGYVYDMIRISVADRSKFEQVQGSRMDEMMVRTGRYGRGKLSPFGHTVADVVTQGDFAGRPMPWSEDRPGKYARRQGLDRWGWGEYVVNRYAPIPVEEMIRETFYASDMDRPFADRLWQGIRAGAITGTTGVRYTEDKDADIVK